MELLPGMGLGLPSNTSVVTGPGKAWAHTARIPISDSLLGGGRSRVEAQTLGAGDMAEHPAGERGRSISTSRKGRIGELIVTRR